MDCFSACPYSDIQGSQQPALSSVPINRRLCKATMSSYDTHKTVLAASGAGQDRADIFATDSGVVLVVADGAGGISHGDRAAELVVAKVRAEAQDTFTKRDGFFWAGVLTTLDLNMNADRTAGECTAVVIEVS